LIDGVKTKVIFFGPGKHSKKEKEKKNMSSAIQFVSPSMVTGRFQKYYIATERKRPNRQARNPASLWLACSASLRAEQRGKKFEPSSPAAATTAP
jgi:hypothetical protein